VVKIAFIIRVSDVKKCIMVLPESFLLYKGDGPSNIVRVLLVLFFSLSDDDENKNESDVTYLCSKFDSFDSNEFG
jgi:hypothetical protein